MEENNRQNIPTFCRNHCGFYGSPSFDYLCSKCHRSSAAQREDAQIINRTPSDITPKISSPEPRKSSRSNSRCECQPKNDQPTVTVTTNDTSENETPTSPSLLDLSKSAGGSPSEPEADAEVAAVGLPDTLLPNLKDDDSKPGSPASSCSSTGETTKKPSRCAVCNKRVGLTGFRCRCGGLFCSAHRYSEVHDCSFDYRVSGQEEIRRSNPQIVSEKVQKI